MKGTYQDLINDARDMQADLDNYDDNEWKQHVLGAIGDTWNAYKMAGFGETLWEGGQKLFAKEGIKENAPITELFKPADPLTNSFTDTTPTILDQIETEGLFT